MPKLEIPFSATNENIGRVIFVGKISVYPYEGGKRQKSQRGTARQPIFLKDVVELFSDC